MTDEKLKEGETFSDSPGEKICSGKHEGKTASDIGREDPEYILWLDTLPGMYFSETTLHFCRAQIEKNKPVKTPEERVADAVEKQHPIPRRGAVVENNNDFIRQLQNDYLNSVEYVPAAQPSMASYGSIMANALRQDFLRQQAAAAMQQQYASAYEATAEAIRQQAVSDRHRRTVRAEFPPSYPDQVWLRDGSDYWAMTRVRWESQIDRQLFLDEYSLRLVGSAP